MDFLPTHTSRRKHKYMANFYNDNPDLQFYIDREIDWEPLLELTELGKADTPYESWQDARDNYKEILAMLGEFSAEEIAPYWEELDTQESKVVNGEVVEAPRMAQIFERIRELELHGLCLPRELGGMNCPLLLHSVTAELLARSDAAIMTHYSFHGGMALAMLIYSLHEGSTEVDPEHQTIIKTRFEEQIREIVRGDAWGSMDITEPHAGSDMAALKTKATQDDDGNWWVTGQKIFITSGHGRHHFVVARTDNGEKGLDGLSLFLVEAYATDAAGNRVRTSTIDRAEEKMGHHASATVAISFEKSPAHLLGKLGEGFRQMLLIMNNARINVGFEAIGLSENALRLAKAYAADRGSMGKAIDQHEMIADMLEEMQEDIIGVRAMAMAAGYDEEISQRYSILALAAEGSEKTAYDAEIKRRRTRCRHLTPLLKHRAAEKAVEHAQRCIQIHGGAGYISEYGAEKLLRDAIILPIYEGTSQIQALMATKDALGSVLKAPFGFAAELVSATLTSWLHPSRARRGVARLRRRCLSMTRLLMLRIVVRKFRTNGFKVWDQRRDFAPALLHAERLTVLLTDATIADLLATQSARFPERRIHLQRHLERSEGRARQAVHEIRHNGKLLLRRLAASEG
jgi:3-(methylthio)propanoyl-CoA dehydrogenase